jgi:RNA ligase
VIYTKLSELHDLVATGYCTRRRHARLPLWIYNYSQRAQFDYKAHDWPQVLRDARGLVLDEDGQIIARGFAKFFNLSQLPQIPGGHPEFWEKVDGSLILLFSYEGERVFSTRGSFESAQALWANRWFATHAPEYHPPVGETVLLEAVYPGNRVVVDYGGQEELVALGSVDLAGADTDLWQTLPSRIRRAVFHGVRDPRTIPATEGEGFVLRWPDGTRAKVKLDEYVRLHRLIFGTSTKTIWAALRAGEAPEETTVELPVELRDWIREQAVQLRGRFDGVLAEAQSFLEEARRLGLTEGPRKEFAEWVRGQAVIKEHGLSGLIFRLADGKDTRDDIWRMIEPVFAQPAWLQSADAE